MKPDAEEDTVVTKKKIEPKGFDNNRPYRVVITYDDGITSSRPCHDIEAAIIKGAKLMRETRVTGRHCTIALVTVEVVPDTDPDSPAASRRIYTTLAEGIADDVLAEADDTWLRSPMPDQHAVRAAFAAAGITA